MAHFLASCPTTRRTGHVVALLFALPKELLRDTVGRMAADKSGWMAIAPKIRSAIVSVAITKKALARETDAWVDAELAACADIPGWPMLTYLGHQTTLTADADAKRIAAVCNDESVEIKVLLVLVRAQYDFIKAHVDVDRDIRDPARRAEFSEMMAAMATHRRK